MGMLFLMEYLYSNDFSCLMLGQIQSSASSYIQQTSIRAGVFFVMFYWWVAEAELNRPYIPCLTSLLMVFVEISIVFDLLYIIYIY